MTPGDFQDVQWSGKFAPRAVPTACGVVECAETGDGPVVVSLHGAMGGYDQGLLLAQTIGEAGYRYLAMSRPGYLNTPLSSGRGPEQQGDLIAALLDTLGIGQAGVMAVSGGGPSAIQFALRHPGRCKGLILVSTCADKVDARIPLSFRAMMFLARWPGFVKRFRRKAERNLEAVARRSVHDPDLLARTMEDVETWELFSTMLVGTFDRMERRLEGTANDIEVSRTATYRLEDLRVPVLIIHGTKDRLVTFEVHARMFQRRVPNAELLAVDGGEHVAIFTHRDLVKGKVAGFMRRHFASQMLLAP